MSKCKKCCKEFKYQWCLDRHLRRKIPCKENNEKVDHCHSLGDNSPSSDDHSHSLDDHSHSLGNKLCLWCQKNYTSNAHLKRHLKTCKLKDNEIRKLEIQTDTTFVPSTTCKYCNIKFSNSYNLSRHMKKCNERDIYKLELLNKLKEKTKSQPAVTNITNNTNNTNNNTINVVNISAETLRKFGEENTDHITNAYLRQIMGRLGVTIPKIVSNVAKKIYCDESKPENQTIQISNVRSQWAKVSNGSDYELQALGDSVKGVRNKVTDLYVTRLCDDFEFFKKVTARIDRLDDLNNQNYTARTLEDKEDQKNASKLKGEIDREIKSAIYNVQKAGLKIIKS